MRQPCRRLAGVASGLLALTLTSVPAANASAPAPPGRERDETSAVEDWVESALARSPHGDDESVRSPLRRWSAPDRRGDAERGNTVVLRGPRSFRDLADLTGVAYRTPTRRGGDLVVRSRWAALGDARAPGVRRQSFFALLDGPGERSWIVGATNFDDRVRVSQYEWRKQVDVTPRSASVRRTFGPDGTITVTVSAEWLDAARVEVVSAAFSRGAVDRSPYSPRLDVGRLRD